MKEEIINAAIDKFKDYPGLLSLSPVGSHANREKPLERTNDFDLILIFDKLTTDILENLKKEAAELAKTLDRPNHAVWPEFRVGPIKALCPRPADFCTMLHFLVFDVGSFNDYIKLSPFITLDWSQFSPLIGKPLNQLFTFTWPTSNDLISAPRHSIAYYRKIIREKVYVFVTMENKNGRLIPVPSSTPMNESQFAEVCSNTMNKLMLNAVILYSHSLQQWSADQLLKKFIEVLPFFKGEEKTLAAINGLKSKIRKGEQVPFSSPELEQMMNSFFDNLEREVQIKK